jgi:DNA-binding MarR family transcriptional regulator
VAAHSPVSGQLFRLTRVLLRRTQMELASDPGLAEAGLRPIGVAVLSTVERQGPMSQREISDALFVDPSDLVTVLDVLEHAGYIERQKDTEDRRRNAVHLTAEGKHVKARALEIVARVEDELLADLTPAQRAELGSLLGLATGTA